MRENRPLTTLQLAEKITEASWNTNYIDKLLGQLVKKGFDKLVDGEASSPATATLTSLR